MDEHTNIRIHVVGSGAREHALCWALDRSPRTVELTCSPGNAGIAQVARCVPIDATDVDATADWCAEHDVDLVVVGPESALAAGLVDELESRGVAAFGPTAAAARIESSKAFAKDVMARAGVPTARYRVFEDADLAADHIRAVGAPVVVKADGLAAGKGVVVAATAEEATDAARRLLVGPGARVLVEECLEGPELSVLCFTDGRTVRLLPPARDHKRALDGDEGPNTGGMGAYAPVPDVSDALLEEIRTHIVQPVVDELRAAGTPFRGILYAGLMLTAAGPRVIEFNARPGDPETQALLPLLTSDPVAVLLACTRGTLDQVVPTFAAGAAVCVVAAGRSYPAGASNGAPISGIGTDSGTSILFHAGTTTNADGELVTAGGRVLAVTGLGPNIALARAAAYQRLRNIGCPDLRHRTDIATSFPPIPHTTTPTSTHASPTPTSQEHTQQ